MDPAPKQAGVDAVSHRHGGHRDPGLLRGLHRLRLELRAVNSPPAAWRCLIHSAYVPIKSLMDTSILGTTQRINMTCLDAYLEFGNLKVRFRCEADVALREDALIPMQGNFTGPAAQRACSNATEKSIPPCTP
jgi:hypothetical protein